MIIAAKFQDNWGIRQSGGALNMHPNTTPLHFSVTHPLLSNLECLLHAGRISLAVLIAPLLQGIVPSRGHTPKMSRSIFGQRHLLRHILEEHVHDGTIRHGFRALVGNVDLALQIWLLYTTMVKNATCHHAKSSAEPAKRPRMLLRPLAYL